MTRQSGVSLIEVLIALLVLGIGILGMVALQTRSLALDREAYLRSQAESLAYDLGDRIRANEDQLNTYAIAIKDGKPSGSSLAKRDLTDWLGDIASALPGGDGSVVVNGDEAVITVEWSSSPSLGGNKQRFETWVRP
ncbi:type IV pilus assembly protein PilV [Onishia taeanensis]|uniref:Type IV pilus assembly protein PilV n=1 Tax=Onishia taeanensis TaxID=284577 RepID=A0A1G7TNJ7_9GAMM|nr:type IV pilus modification protein PilV [Halomonas taeanensis]SDG36594.1 type IV pilus assembly protein PilV [Halomonas taeanensis]